MADETASYKPPILVLGLANEMLKDDGTGVRVAEKLQPAFPRERELSFPREVRILAIPVDDPTAFSSEMSPRVAARVPGAADRARRVVRRWRAESKPEEHMEHAPAERCAGAQPLEQEVIYVR